MDAKDISVSYQYHISIISVSYHYHISIISVSYQHMGNPAGGTMRFTSPWDAARFYGYRSRLNTSKMGDDDESAIQPPQKKKNNRCPSQVQQTMDHCIPNFFPGLLVQISPVGGQWQTFTFSMGVFRCQV